MPTNKFKPFDRVLVRDEEDDEWVPQFFSRFFDDGDTYPYQTVNGDVWAECIPYEGNEDKAWKC